MRAPQPPADMSDRACREPDFTSGERWGWAHAPVGSVVAGAGGARDGTPRIDGAQGRN